MPELIEQPSPRPSRKVTASTAGAALLGPVLVGVAVWLGATQPPAGLEGGLATVGAFLAGYWFKESA